MCDVPLGQQAQFMAATSDRLIVRTDASMGLWLRPLADPTAAWEWRFRGDRFWGLAVAGGKVYSYPEGKLVSRPLDAPGGGWSLAGPCPSEGADATVFTAWGDHLVLVPADRQHAPLTRRLSDGPEVGWKKLGPNLTPTGE